MKTTVLEVSIWFLIMASDRTLSFSVASVVEDVLQQHENQLKDFDLESRRAEETGNSALFFELNAFSHDHNAHFELMINVRI